jgi:hypothetical protein
MPTFHYAQKATPKLCSNNKHIQRDVFSFTENEIGRYSAVKKSGKWNLPALYHRKIAPAALSASNGRIFAIEYIGNEQQ